MKLVERFIKSFTTLPYLSALCVKAFYSYLGELDFTGAGTESFVSSVESNRALETRTPGNAST